MKLFQQSLRALIVAGSLGGFLGGWSLLAHAGKPVQTQPGPAIVVPTPQLPAAIPTLAPVKPMPSTLQPLPTLPPKSPMMWPRLRTGGS